MTWLIRHLLIRKVNLSIMKVIRFKDLEGFCQNKVGSKQERIM